MRLLCTFILVCGMTTIIACGDDDGGTSAPPEEMPLAASTIGDDGGTLATDDFTLDVPAGAFPVDTELLLYEASADDLPDNSVTGVYRLEGLPDIVAEPLTISMLFSNAPSGNLLIGAGFETTSLETDQTRVLYTYLDATVDDGRLTSEWQPPDADSQATKFNTRLAFLFGPQNTEVTYVPDEWIRHFKICAPLVGRDLVPDVGEALEQAYQLYLDLGFDFQLAGNSEEVIAPVTVVFTHGEPCEGQYVSGQWLSWTDSYSSSGMCVFHDRMTPGDLDALKIAVQSRLAVIIHRAQIQHTFTNPAYDWVNHWMEPAVRLWAEGLFAGPDHVPHDLDMNGWDFADGLIYSMLGDPGEDWEFGKAMPTLLKYLMDLENNGAALLLRTYDITRQDEPTGYAFLNAIAGDSSDWWPDFLEALLSGELYDLESDAFLGQAIDYTLNEQTWETTLTNFYPDLSARLYQFNPTYAGWGGGAFMDLVVSSPDVNASYLDLLVFELRDGEISFLTSGTDVRINDLASFRDDGAELLVLVSNAAWTMPSSVSEINLEVTVDEGAAVIDAHMYISVNIVPQYDGLTPNQGIDTEGNEDLNGTFDGSIFNGSYEWTNGEWTWTCTATCRLDRESDPPRLLEWSFVKDIVATDGHYEAHIEASGGEVPHYVSGSSVDQFYLLGMDVCDTVDALVIVRTEYGEVVGELVDFSCNENSCVRVDFYPWIFE